MRALPETEANSFGDIPPDFTKIHERELSLKNKDSSQIAALFKAARLKRELDQTKKMLSELHMQNNRLRIQIDGLYVNWCVSNRAYNESLERNRLLQEMIEVLQRNISPLAAIKAPLSVSIEAPSGTSYQQTPDHSDITLEKQRLFRLLGLIASFSARFVVDYQAKPDTQSLLIWLQTVRELGEENSRLGYMSHRLWKENTSLKRQLNALGKTPEPLALDNPELEMFLSPLQATHRSQEINSSQ